MADDLTVEERLDPFLIIRHAMRMLADRALLWVVVMLSFTLFGHAAMHPGPWTFSGAATFTVLALALMWRGKR